MSLYSLLTIEYIYFFICKVSSRVRATYNLLEELPMFKGLMAYRELMQLILAQGNILQAIN